MRALAILAALILAPTVPAAAQANFVRGDCNVDGANDIGDAVFTLGVLFSGQTPSSCPDACDGNDDGAIDIADAVYELSFLFSAGAPPEAPYPGCGLDPTADATPCASYAFCTAVEICDNGVDDDTDGFTDCDDFDCVASPGCALSHAIDIQPIWDANCTICHAGPNPFAGLNLEPGIAYGAILGVASSECSVLDFVDPFSPSTSWLYRKVAGTHTAADITSLGCTIGTGNQMPPGAFGPLTPAEIDLVEQWILGGAAP